MTICFADKSTAQNEDSHKEQHSERGPPSAVLGEDIVEILRDCFCKGSYEIMKAAERLAYACKYMEPWVR